MLQTRKSDDDVWDDRALIKAYDKAVAQLKVSKDVIFTVYQYKLCKLDKLLLKGIMKIYPTT